MESLLHKYMSTTSLPPTCNAVKSLTASFSWLPSRYWPAGFRFPPATSSLPEQAPFPQHLFTWQVLQPWQLCWPLINMIQFINIFPVFEVPSAGCNGLDLNSANWKGILPRVLLPFFVAHKLLFSLLPPSSFCAELISGQASHHPQPLLMPGTLLSEVQDFAFVAVDFQNVPCWPHPPACPGYSEGQPGHWAYWLIVMFCIICRLDEDTFPNLLPVIVTY